MITRTKALIGLSVLTIGIITGTLLVANAIATPNITEEEAKRIAEEEVGGDAKAQSAKLEDDETSPYYDVIVKNEDGYWEVEVNADTGAVNEVEGPSDQAEIDNEVIDD